MSNTFFRNKLVYKLIIFFFPLIVLAIFIVLKVKFPEIYRPLTWEDSYIENAQFIFYLATAFFALYMSITFFRNGDKLFGFLYLLLSLGLFFISFEEISWGQRIFGFETFGFFSRRNYQNELNVHNISGFTWVYNKFYQLVGIYGSLFWIFLLVKSKKISKASFLGPDWFLALYFFPTIFRHIYFNVAYVIDISSVSILSTIDQYSVWRQQEPTELVLALGFFLFVFISMFRQKKTIKLMKNSYQQEAKAIPEV